MISIIYLKRLPAKFHFERNPALLRSKQFLQESLKVCISTPSIQFLVAFDPNLTLPLVVIEYMPVKTQSEKNSKKISLPLKSSIFFHFEALQVYTRYT